MVVDEVEYVGAVDGGTVEATSVDVVEVVLVVVRVIVVEVVVDVEGVVCGGEQSN